MSLFAKYIEELAGKEIIEDELGFATFYQVNDGMYIEDIFVLPYARKSGHASLYADKIAVIAQERGLKKLYGSIKPSNKTSTEAMKTLLAYGFRIDSSAMNAIALVKELE